MKLEDLTIQDVTQSIIAIGLLLLMAALLVAQVPVPEWVSAVVVVIVGYYFGESAAQRGMKAGHTVTATATSSANGHNGANNNTAHGGK